jgi:hypothetical protein
MSLFRNRDNEPPKPRTPRPAPPPRPPKKTVPDMPKKPTPPPRRHRVPEDKLAVFYRLLDSEPTKYNKYCMYKEMAALFPEVAEGGTWVLEMKKGNPLHLYIVEKQYVYFDHSTTYKHTADPSAFIKTTEREI